jgi:hypothetical protein
MESTGVCRRSASPVLERSFQIVVGNAHHIKTVPGWNTSQNMLLSTRGIIGDDRRRDHSVDARDLPQQRKLSVMGKGVSRRPATPRRRPRSA